MSLDSVTGLDQRLTEELNDGRMVRTFGEDVTTTSEGRNDQEGDTDTFRMLAYTAETFYEYEKKLTRTGEGVAQSSIRIFKPFTSGTVGRDKGQDSVTPTTTLCYH